MERQRRSGGFDPHAAPAYGNGMMEGEKLCYSFPYRPTDVGAKPMKKLVLETTSPFQGLAELVAYDDGLFTMEGVQVEWADRDEACIKTSDTSIKDVKATNMFGSHGTLLEQGKADMYK